MVAVNALYDLIIYDFILSYLFTFIFHRGMYVVSQLQAELNSLPGFLAAFPAKYEEARRNFCLAAEGERLPVDSHRHALTGPFGELLACDVVWAGPRAARRVLVLISATHGVDGFCGSAIQTDWLAGGGPGHLPDSCAVMLIHAINPWGFAWLRQVTEDGINLNRNFIDFSSALPDDTAYSTVADDVVPASLDAKILAQADDHLKAFIESKTEGVAEHLLASGQYSHPEGLFYGGSGPSWSRIVLESLVRDYDLAGRASLCVVDVRSGSGPFGYGGLSSACSPESRAARMARLWFGASVSDTLSVSTLRPARYGLSDYFWHPVVGERGCMLGLEFGTWPWTEVFAALRADHGLYRTSRTLSWHDPGTRVVKAAVRRAFYPDTPDWQEMVMTRGRQVIRQAVVGLSEMGI